MKYMASVVMVVLVLLVIYTIVFNIVQIDHQQTIRNLETTIPFLEEQAVTESNFRGNCHYLKIKSDIYVEDESRCRPWFPSERLKVFTEDIQDLYMVLEDMYNQYEYTVALIGFEYHAQTITNAEFYIACAWCDYSYIYIYDATGERIARLDERALDLHYTHQDWYVYAYN